MLLIKIGFKGVPRILPAHPFHLQVALAAEVVDRISHRLPFQRIFILLLRPPAPSVIDARYAMQPDLFADMYQFARTLRFRQRRTEMKDVAKFTRTIKTQQFPENIAAVFRTRNDVAVIR